MKKLVKMMAACMLCTTVMTGCGNTDDKDDMPVVSVAQIVSHKSLNTIRDSFTAQMKELGYEDGKNIEIDYKDAGNQQSNLDSIMSTFAGNKSDVIVAIATPTALAAAKYSKDIPVVFSAVSDPVGANLMSDLKKPEHNITGTSDEIQVAQILSLALQINPDVKKMGFIYNSSEANSVSNLEKAKKFCKDKNIELIEGSGSNITEIQSAVSVLVEKCDAIFAPNDNTVANSMSALVEAANKKQVPVYTGADSMVSDGGFASVGIDYTDLGKETAKMVDKILKGTKVADIPVKVFKEDLNIYVNEKTMKAIGVTLPGVVKDSKNLVMMK